MGKFLFLILFTILTFEVNGQVPSIKGQDDTTKMYPVNYEVPGKKAIKLNSTTVLLDTDQDNLLVNGGFEAQDVTLGWVKSTATSIDFIDSGTFEGKKSRAIRFGGTVANYRAEVNLPEYIGRQAIAGIYYKSDITWGAEVPDICVYAGTTSNIVSGTCRPLQKTGNQWYRYTEGFFWSEAVMGLVIRNNGAIDLLNSVYLDKASIKLDKNEGLVANIEGDYQYERWSYASSIITTTDLTLLTNVERNSNSQIYNLTSSGILFNRKSTVRVTVSGTQMGTGARYTIASILKNGGVVNNNGTYRDTVASSSLDTGSSAEFDVEKGDVVTVTSGSGNAKLTILATARSQVTVFPDETFSTDINPVFWKATQCGETEIGCYNTYSYAGGSNTRTLCATRPTSQTDAEMRVQGPRLYTRVFANAGSCNTPTEFYFIIGKNFSSVDTAIYKDTTRAVAGVLEYKQLSTSVTRGAWAVSYNSATGGLSINAGYIYNNTVTDNGFTFSDISTATSGYLVIKASKTGLGMANVPARYPVKFIESGKNSATVYNNGWVEQQGELAANTKDFSLIVAMRDTNYVPLTGIIHTSTPSDYSSVIVRSSITTTGFSAPTAFANMSFTWRVSGWGASSVVKQYGANPAY